ncbi:MAG: geranylgeranyl reductase family protein [Candidatus Methanospirareceae archaeon]
MVIKCDVLVVGAGPAGSSAARAAAEAGASTICIDKKEEIGRPVQCAEGIGTYLFPFLPFRIPENQLVWEIKGISFWAESLTIERCGGFWSGYAINRANFDTWLATRAVNAGAKLQLETELMAMEFNEEYHVTKAIVKTGHDQLEIEPTIVIAADGADSTVLELLQVKKNSTGLVGEIKSYEMHNLHLDKPYDDQIFLGDFAPGAYGYIFPKSRTTANVGTGFLFPKKNLDHCFAEFLEVPVVKRQLRNAHALEEKSGRVPIGHLTDKKVYGNVLLVGDAANQNIKPLVEGFLPAIICGDIAGKRAIKYLTKNGNLSDYPYDIDNKLGIFFNESNAFLTVAYDLLKSEDPKDKLLLLGLNSNVFSSQKIEKLKKRDYETVRQKLVDWTNSKIKQSFTILSEKKAFLCTGKHVHFPS